MPFEGLGRAMPWPGSHPGSAGCRTSLFLNSLLSSRHSSQTPTSFTYASKEDVGGFEGSSTPTEVCCAGDEHQLSNWQRACTKFQPPWPPTQLLLILPLSDFTEFPHAAENRKAPVKDGAAAWVQKHEDIPPALGFLAN